MIKESRVLKTITYTLYNGNEINFLKRLIYLNAKTVYNLLTSIGQIV